MPEAPVTATWTSAVPSAVSRLLEVVGGADHLVAVGGGAAHHDRGVPVGADGRALGGLGDRGDPRRRPRARRRRRATVRRNAGESTVWLGAVDDDHQAGAVEAAELALDEVADLDRLRAVGLPAGAGERVLDPRGEDPEADGEDRPGDEDDAGVARPPSGRGGRSGRRRAASVRVGRVVGTSGAAASVVGSSGHRPLQVEDAGEEQRHRAVADDDEEPLVDARRTRSSSRNHGLTRAARAAAIRTTVPAIAKRTRSSGQRRVALGVAGAAHERPPTISLSSARRSWIPPQTCSQSA